MIMMRSKSPPWILFWLWALVGRVASFVPSPPPLPTTIPNQRRRGCSVGGKQRRPFSLHVPKRKVHLSSLSLSNINNNNNNNNSVEQEIAELERQILFSAKQRMDYNQITRALQDNDNNNINKLPLDMAKMTRRVALTAATVTAGSSFLLFHNVYVSAFVFGATFLVANTDPLQDDDDENNYNTSVLGALARIVGRATLQSYETSYKPKLQAMARAAVTGQDELQELKQQLQTLQQERYEMETWKQFVYGPNNNNVHSNTKTTALNNSSRDQTTTTTTTRKQTLDQEIAEIERQIQASVQERMDYNQVQRALDDAASSSHKNAVISAAQHTWQVAATAATLTAAGSFLLFSNIYVSIFVWISIFIVANTDPLQDDSLGGAVARLLGQATLQSYESSVKPKMQALARAVVTGQDEVRELRQQLDHLQQQTNELVLWKQRRLWVEDNLQYYTVEDLKQQARLHQLPVGGTKLQLLQRLVDAQVIDTTS